MSKPRAFVEEYGSSDGMRRMVAVYEHNPPSQIHRQDLHVRTTASEAEVLLVIAAAWNLMASRALVKKKSITDADKVMQTNDATTPISNSDNP
jgi:hypothetical protein